MDKCNILGINVVVTNMRKTIDYIEENLEILKGKYICVTNVHTTVMAYEDNDYREIQNRAVLILPDGRPLSLISKNKGFKESERVTGPDLMNEIFKLSEINDYKHYFYGSTKETLKKLEKNLLQDYPKIKIVGMYSPPFKSNIELENEEIINQINSVKPDFIWVGLGAPKQEIWMSLHENVLDGVMIGVGAGFDYYAGNIKRAPKWMQRCSLEWVYRLIQDPKRLFSRYLITNSKFIYLISCSKKRLNKERKI